jgi:pSer/pThr/pTyr-binding forkhead associated (FHA) protein
VNDPLIVRFADACGATGPLDLRVDLADGGVLAEGTVQQPFTLVGRDDACDVTLTDPEVNPRHAWLQVIAGRVYAIDLGSRTGLVWPDGTGRCGWLDVGTPVQVGPFRVHLRSPPSAGLSVVAPDYDPLRSDPELAASRPVVSLDFRNGRRVKDRWMVNRVVTLVGRADACKIHLNGDDISTYHCGLVLTPAGLWVVDLSGRGVVVNGERMRVAPLQHGAELWVGRFLVGCHYSPAGATSPPGSPPGSGTSLLFPPSTPTEAARRADTDVPEDEVPLGFQPPTDATAGLPSSHIMADAFQILAGLGLTPSAGPVSSPILVSGSSPAPSAVPVPQTLTTADPFTTAHTPPSRPGIGPDLGSGAQTVVALLIRQLGEIHSQMFDQFQQSLLLMMQVFGRMHREQVAALQQELSRIHELNAELGKLQAEVARLTMARVTSKRRPSPPPPSSQDDTAPMIELPAASQPSDSSAAIQNWVVERINVLQQEREARWQKLAGQFVEKPPA